MNRWTSLVAWMVLMLIVWSLFVDKGLTVGTFTLLAATGLVLLVAGSMLWNARKPAPSLRQMRAMESDESGRGRTA